MRPCAEDTDKIADWGLQIKWGVLGEGTVFWEPFLKRGL